MSIIYNNFTIDSVYNSSIEVLLFDSTKSLVTALWNYWGSIHGEHRFAGDYTTFPIQPWEDYVDAVIEIMIRCSKDNTEFYFDLGDTSLPQAIYLLREYIVFYTLMRE